MCIPMPIRILSNYKSLFLKLTTLFWTISSTLSYTNFSNIIPTYVFLLNSLESGNQRNGYQSTCQYKTVSSTEGRTYKKTGPSISQTTVKHLQFHNKHTHTKNQSVSLLSHFLRGIACGKMAAKKVAERLAKSVAEEVARLGCMKQTGVSLRYMMEFGSKPTPRNLLISAQFLHKELPIRIARRVIELHNLPYGLSLKPPVLKVRDWYVDSFRDLTSFPEIKDTNDEKDFTEMIKAIKVRHTNVVPTLALGVQQLKKGMDPKIVYEDLDAIHQFLDRFYMSRIGIRMLIGQHVELHNPDPPPHVVGYIHTKMSPVDVARNAVEDARSVCLLEYGSAPDVHIYGDPNFTFPYVPAHLHLMVFELVKNSLRAVQERHVDSDKISPPVRIIVAEGIEDVTIKVSDEGGGIPRSGLPKIFTYLYSTAKNPLDDHCDLGTADTATMAGYGYGLPISRMYARYFGGDLQMISMEGYGTDAYLHLSRLGDSQEPLP